MLYWIFTVCHKMISKHKSQINIHTWEKLPGYNISAL